MLEEKVLDQKLDIALLKRLCSLHIYGRFLIHIRELSGSGRKSEDDSLTNRDFLNFYRKHINDNPEEARTSPIPKSGINCKSATFGATARNVADSYLSQSGIAQYLALKKTKKRQGTRPL